MKSTGLLLLLWDVALVCLKGKETQQTGRISDVMKARSYTKSSHFYIRSVGLIMARTSKILRPSLRSIHEMSDETIKPQSECSLTLFCYYHSSDSLRDIFSLRTCGICKDTSRIGNGLKHEYKEEIILIVSLQRLKSWTHTDCILQTFLISFLNYE